MGTTNQRSNTIIKTTNACDSNARSVSGGRGWLAGDTDGLAGWPVMVGVVVIQPGADAERYRCAFTLHTGAGWAWSRVEVRPRLGEF